jgi:hypothetical protein
MSAATVATVLFDEAHSEAWTIRSDVAREMQPSHPADASYAAAAETLRKRDFAVASNVAGPLDPNTLAGCDVLVIAHPSDPAWERTIAAGSPELTAAELQAIEAFVNRGGGLVVLGETEQDKYGNNLNTLLARFGIHIASDTVQDYAHNLGPPSWVVPELGEGARGREGDLLARVSSACLYRATTLSSVNGSRVLARAQTTSSAPGAPLIIASEHGHGRVAVLADSDLFGDDCIGELDHRALWLNIIGWAAAGGPPVDRAQPISSRPLPATEPAWVQLRDETDALAALQAPDGSLAGEAVAARRHVDAMIDAIARQHSRFPQQAQYLRAVREDLRAWGDGGFGRPDFTRSLEALAGARSPRRGRERGRVPDV